MKNIYTLFFFYFVSFYTSQAQSIAIQTVSIAPFEICESNEVVVTFSAESPSIATAQTKFRVRFNKTDYYRKVYQSIDVDAEYKDGVLVAKFPKGFNLTERTLFSAQVLTVNPAGIGDIGKAEVWVSPEASVEFVTSSGEVAFGGAHYIAVMFKGLGPFVADLGDDVKIEVSRPLVHVGVRDTLFATKNYQVKSLYSGCGYIENPSNQTVVMTVKPGLVANRSEIPGTLCAGTKARIPIKSSPEFNSTTLYTINASSRDTTRSFIASRDGDFLEFFIPDVPGEGTDYNSESSVYITTTNPIMAPVYAGYQIQTRPYVIQQPRNYYYRGFVSVPYSLRGGNFYRVVDQNDRTYELTWTSEWNHDFFLDKTTDYKLKSISNSCFTNTNLSTSRVKLEPQAEVQGFYVQTSSKLICSADSFDIAIVPTGGIQFATDNVFTIETLTRYNQYTKQVNRSGKHRVLAPTDGNEDIRVKVTSSNPFFQSVVDLKAHHPNSVPIGVSPMGTESNPFSFEKGGGKGLRLDLKYGITSALYSVEDKEISQQFDAFNNVFILPILLEVGNVRKYTVKSVSNICGALPVNVSTYVKVRGYEIILKEFEYNSVSFCARDIMNVSFLTNGNPGDATFSLQIAKENTTDFETIGSVKSARLFRTRLPDSIEPGVYLMRIHSSDGFYSPSVRIVIGSKPTVVLTTDQTQPVLANVGEQIRMKLKFTGSSPRILIYEDGSTQESYYHDEDNREVNLLVSKGQDYYVKSVYNACGYGTASGSVSVKIRPELRFNIAVTFLCEGDSYRGDYSLHGDVELGNDYLRFELIDNDTKNIMVLDSTKNLSGSIQLRIPSPLPGSNYSLRCSVRSLKLYAFPNTSIGVKGNIRLSGNSVINSGESAYLLIRNSKRSLSYIDYELSNGEQGSVYADGYIKVNPSQTTTYTITTASNRCGNAVFSGSATIQVNPVSSRSITTSAVLGLYGRNSFCTGDSIFVHYETKGTFSQGDIKTIQISDTTGLIYSNIPTKGTGSPLRGILPTNMSLGKSYRVRVNSSDVGTGSGAYQYPILPGQTSKAKLASDIIMYNGQSNPTMVVKLEGSSPWSYTYANERATYNRTTYSASDSISLENATPSQYYRLIRVTNQCGEGSVEAPSMARVELITSIPEEFATRILIGPNPVRDMLYLTFSDNSSRVLTLYSIQGTLLDKKTSRKTEESISLVNFSTGVYILKVEEKDKLVSYKIIKE